jgi:hypothetical protein
MDETSRSSFQYMEGLLTTWFAGASLLEVARSIQLAKAELVRRGITLTWSISQIDEPGPYVRPARIPLK